MKRPATFAPTSKTTARVSPQVEDERSCAHRVQPLELPRRPRRKALDGGSRGSAGSRPDRSSARPSTRWLIRARTSCTSNGEGTSGRLIVRRTPVPASPRSAYRRARGGQVGARASLDGNNLVPSAQSTRFRGAAGKHIVNAKWVIPEADATPSYRTSPVDTHARCSRYISGVRNPVCASWTAEVIARIAA
jgi:hypothetical protein